MQRPEFSKLEQSRRLLFACDWRENLTVDGTYETMETE